MRETLMALSVCLWMIDLFVCFECSFRKLWNLSVSGTQDGLSTDTFSSR